MLLSCGSWHASANVGRSGSEYNVNVKHADNVKLVVLPVPVYIKHDKAVCALSVWRNNGSNIPCKLPRGDKMCCCKMVFLCSDSSTLYSSN